MCEHLLNEWLGLRVTAETMRFKEIKQKINLCLPANKDKANRRARLSSSKAMQIETGLSGWMAHTPAEILTDGLRGVWSKSSSLYILK